ncbi:MAG: antitoxin [Acidobacteria bacterium]|nr:antitoxin [Acidobacteriota bacterium]
MNKIKLDKEEQELVDSFERGEWRSVPNFEEEKKRYQEIAAATFKKDRRVNIRISTKDLHGLQIRALEEGIPYQTLISSILHKYLAKGRTAE